jgi:hypothetical protein
MEQERYVCLWPRHYLVNGPCIPVSQSIFKISPSLPKVWLSSNLLSRIGSWHMTPPIWSSWLRHGLSMTVRFGCDIVPEVPPFHGVTVLNYACKEPFCLHRQSAYTLVEQSKTRNEHWIWNPDWQRTVKSSTPKFPWRIKRDVL